MPVRMELARVLIHELKDYQVIELREVAPAQPQPIDPDPDGTAANAVQQVEGGRSFPIIIGLPEAQAIERRLKGIVVKRPQTHDLLASVVTAMGGELDSITINDLREKTYYAQLNIKVPGGLNGTGGHRLIHVDCRPSDAIALGVAGNVPIYVAEHVITAAQQDTDDQ